MENLEENHEEEVTTIPYLNEEIILNILYNFPHETQLRVCSVSKSWLDMITNPCRADSCYSIRLKSYNNLPTTPTLLGFFYPKIEQDSTYIGWAPVLIPEQQDNNNNNNPLPSLPESTLSLLNKPHDDDDDDYMKLKAASNGYLLCQYCQGYDSSEVDEVGIPRLDYYYYSVLNPLSQQPVDLPKVLKPCGESVVGFECLSNHMETSPLSPVRFTVVIIDIGSNINHPLLDVKLFSADQNQWLEFSLSVSHWPKRDSFVPSIGTYYPGLALLGIQGNVFFWFCNDNKCLLVFKQSDHCFQCLELPDHHNPGLTEGYNYRALCAWERRLFYGIQYQKMRVIQVFVYKYLYFDRGESSLWELSYQVCLRELEDKCRRMMKIDDDNGGGGDWVNSIVYKGFYPKNPHIIIFIFQGKLVSYDVKCQKLFVHTTDETQHMSVSDTANDEMNRHWIPCERWAWPRSFPCIPEC